MKTITAKKMFKKLGYTNYSDEFKGRIIYSKPIKMFVNINVITFFLQTQEVMLGTMQSVLSKDLIKAIYQQCRELGWIDE